MVPPTGGADRIDDNAVRRGPQPVLVLPVPLQFLVLNLRPAVDGVLLEQRPGPQQMVAVAVSLVHPEAGVGEVGHLLAAQLVRRAPPSLAVGEQQGEMEGFSLKLSRCMKARTANSTRS